VATPSLHQGGITLAVDSLGEPMADPEYGIALGSLGCG
jgi:hypothetical protein